MSCSINHLLLIIVIQTLPQGDDGVCLLVVEEEGRLLPKLHQELCQAVHMLVPRDVSLINSLCKRGNDLEKNDKPSLTLDINEMQLMWTVQVTCIQNE